jgi:hypothetical protein
VRSRGNLTDGIDGSDGNACRPDELPEDSSERKSIGGNCVGLLMAGAGLSVTGLPACARNPHAPKNPAALPATINQRSFR